MAKTLEELDLENQRLLAVEDCRYIMGGYMSIGANFLWEWYMDQWADREDCIIQMPWGAYEGKSGVERCYLVDHCDCTDPEYPNWLRGNMCVHLQNTETIIVAEDGQTARGCWVCTGAETFGMRARDNGYDAGGNKGGTGIKAGGFGGWCWGKYDCDFIKTDDGWKLLHMHLYPLILSHVQVPWTEQAPYKGLSRDTTHTDLDYKVYQINRENVYPTDMPTLPKPYKTFTDVAPGYGRVFNPDL